MKLRSVLALFVASFGIYAVGFVAFGSPSRGIGDQKLAALQGCYEVRGKPAFRIVGATIIALGERPGFEAKRQKDRDVLALDRPIEMAFQPTPALVRAGQTTLIPIRYGKPLSLEFWDTDMQPAFATKVACGRSRNVR